MSFLGGIVDYWKEADAYAFKERDRIDAKVTQLIPLLRKDKETSTLKQQKAEEALSWWESKFSDYEGGDEKRKAVLNLVSQNPFKALKVAQEIQKFEEVTGNRTVKGDKLLEFYDIIEQTKPADMEESAWITKAAELVTEPAVKNVDDIIVRLLNPNLTAEEFNEIYADYQPTTLPADPFVQFDYANIREMPPNEITKVIESIFTASSSALSSNSVLGITAFSFFSSSVSELSFNTSFNGVSSLIGKSPCVRSVLISSTCFSLI